VARKKHKVRRSRGRLGKVIQFLCIVAVLAAMTVGATVFFQVEQIEVSGNHRYTQEEIVAVTGIVAGDNLFRMNKFAIQDRVKEEMPYIEDILIRRKLPSTITVAVQEWDAVAQVLPNPGWAAPEPEETQDGEEAVLPVATPDTWLISVGGKVLEQAPAEDDRMEISGLTGLDVRAGLPLGVPEEEQLRLVGERTGAVYSFGMELPVCCVAANGGLGQVDFLLVDENGEVIPPRERTAIPVKKKKPEKPHEAVIRKKQKKDRLHAPKNRRKGKRR